MQRLIIVVILLTVSTEASFSGLSDGSSVTRFLNLLGLGPRPIVKHGAGFGAHAIPGLGLPGVTLPPRLQVNGGFPNLNLYVRPTSQPFTATVTGFGLSGAVTDPLAVFALTITTAQACEDQCRGNVDCYAFEFVVTGPICYLYGISHACRGLLQGVATTTFGKLNFRTCEEGTHAPKGILQPGITDLRSCINACTGTCAGVDFNQVDNTCFFHGALTACQFPVAAKGVIHIERTQCMDINRVAPSTDNGITGGTRVNGLSSSIACRRACMKEPTCAAVDFDRVAMVCYVHTTTTGCASATNPLVPDIGTDHYEFNCP